MKALVGRRILFHRSGYRSPYSSPIEATVVEVTAGGWVKVEFARGEATDWIKEEDIYLVEDIGKRGTA